MPIVTVDPGEFTKHELKTAPPDGYVMLRPLPYGAKLSRRSKQTKMMMRTQTPQKGKRAPAESVMEFESMDEWTVAHDFKYCIGEHNLTDSNGVTLDFTNPMVFKSLDPRVGSEIEAAIDKLNNDEDEETLDDFLGRSSSSLEDEESSLETGGGEDTPTPANESN